MASLTLSGSSSNTRLVPNGNITFGGSGAARTISVATAPGKSGTATLTVTVSDGTAPAGSVAITVIAGSDRNETLTGTGGTDMIFGLDRQEHDQRVRRHRPTLRGGPRIR